VATQDGLNRFDGKTFIEYNKNVGIDKHKVIAADCRDLYIDTIQQKLWVLANEGGINVINYRTGRVEETIIRKSNNPDDWAISFEFANQKLWIATGSGLSIYNTVTQRFESDPLSSILSKMVSATSQIRFCKKDVFGNIWAGINGVGIALINSKTNELIKIIPLNELNDHSNSGIIQFNSALAFDNKLLFGTSQGLRLIEYDKEYNTILNNAPCSKLSVLNTNSIQWLGKGQDDRVFISAGGFYSVNLSLADPITYKEPSAATTDWFTDVSSGCFVNNDLLFIGCKGGLAIMRLTQEPFEAITNETTGEQKLGHIFSLWPYSDDSIIAASNNGLHLVLNKRHIKTLKNDGFNQNISSFLNNQILASNPKGLRLYDKKDIIKLSNIYPELKELNTWEINSTVKMNDSVLVLGTENFSGIVLWNFKSKTTTKINQNSSPLKLEADIVNTIYKDAKNRLWVLSDKVITVISPDLRTSTRLGFTDSTSGLPTGLFFDMCEANGFYWLATYSTGIIQLDSSFKIKRIFTQKDGLCNSGVYKIFNSENKRLFITTNNGLSVFNLNTYSFKSYYQIDGLHSSAFEEASGISFNDKIFAGGVNGFTIIDPKKIFENESPPLLYLSHFEIETQTGKIDSADLEIEKIKIPNNFTQVKIFFTALNYYNPNRVKYSYKITELYSSWIELGSQNFISLIGLAPGTYHLQVQAFNEDGVPSEIKELTLIFLPKWHQTLFFKILVALAIIAIGYALYRIRINQFKKEQQIRSKIASDLHDDLGSTMNSVKIYANLAIMEKQADKYLPLIKDGTQNAITGIRDIIWVLDDTKDSIEHLLSRINTFASPLCEANSIKFKLELPDNARDHKLGQEERRNLYMMLKEAVNNAVKYSGGQTIDIEVSVTKGKPAFLVKDDGKGFDTAKNSEGNGLKNMQRRAREIKYIVQMNSSAGGGTTITFEKT